MMSLSTPFIVPVAALLLNTLSCCSADNVYCVTPTVPANTSCSSCPRTSTHCATLSEYAQKAELYFTSNITVMFLPGDHVLNINITVANVARLTMFGQLSSDSVAVVFCNCSVGFRFMSIVDFKVHSLAFTSCSRNFNSHVASKYTILLEFIEFAELVNCSFYDNLGTALVMYSSNITLAGNNAFTHNHCKGVIPNFCVGGGGITALNSKLTFIGNTTFLKNIANLGAAGLYIFNCSLRSMGNIHFINNSQLKRSAAAIWTNESSLEFTGTSSFINNTAGIGGVITFVTNYTLLSFTGTSNFNYNSVSNGGAIYISGKTVISFNGTSNFISNSADTRSGCGGAIYGTGNTILSFTGATNFNYNSASNGGAIFISGNSVLTFNGTSNFIKNSADTRSGCGGAIYATGNTLLSFTGASNFNYNSAHEGGALFTSSSSSTSSSFNGTSNFINNSADSGYGGAIRATDNTASSFTGTSNFITNFALVGGGISAEWNTSLKFTGASNFINNIAKSSGGAIYSRINTLLSFTGSSHFSDNSAQHLGGGIVALEKTSLAFHGIISFVKNIAVGRKRYHDYGMGGGLYLHNSTISILPNTNMYWENNSAASLGGAIYVKDQSNPSVYCTQTDTSEDECFFQLPGQNLSDGVDAQFVFKDNSAVAAGNALYGGAVDKCRLTGLDSYCSGEVFDKLVHIKDNHKLSSISSVPFRVCLCEQDYPNCTKSKIRYDIYPGGTFQLPVVAVGQRNGTVSTYVRSRINQGNLLDFQYMQRTYNTCTILNYTVFSLSYSEVDLYANDHCSSDKLVLELRINSTCPPGFSISESASSCGCEQRLKVYTNQCDILNGITRGSLDSFWVGYDQIDGLLLHPHCPFDYCVSYRVIIPLNNTDLQCAYNRSGLLCGACNNGYSLVLGTSQCKQCTNSHLFLLIPFALMGLALVFFLLVCKISVATGTLSGLLFYANIFGVNRTIFLPVESTNALSVFIAWLNLDFGIETCFYNGMDAYSKIWLQFVFPVYIWVITGLIMLVSSFSWRFTKLIGNNPVSVLATLILLSYTKILRTLIAAIHITYLEYPTYNKGVWLYDANVDYLRGKHIPLFLIALIFFVILFLPYTLLLLFGQWLQAISHLRLFAWVSSARLMPFMDSYHAPYKAKHRYWPGLLLVIRFVLLLLSAYNFQKDPSIDLLAILVGISILTLWAWASGGVYRNWNLDALEGSVVLNLIILIGATYHVNHSGGNQLIVGYSSVAILFVTFIGILVYHIFQQVRATKLWKKIPRINLKVNKVNLRYSMNHPEVVENIQLRESLLEDPEHLN